MWAFNWDLFDPKKNIYRKQDQELQLWAFVFQNVGFEKFVFNFIDCKSTTTFPYTTIKNKYYMFILNHSLLGRLFQNWNKQYILKTLGLFSTIF